MILLVHPEPRVREILAFVLEQRFAVHIECVAYLERALLILPQKPRMVIYSETAEKDPLFKRFIKEKTGVPSILITSGSGTDVDGLLDRDLFACVAGTDLLDNLCVTLERLAAEHKISLQPATETEQLSEFEYCCVRTTQLTYSCPFQVGIYIKLSNSHFVKIFNPGDRFDADDLERYLFTKKIEYFWIKRSDAPVFIDQYRALIEAYLKVEITDVKAAGMIVVDASETVHALAERMGYTPPVQDLIKSNIMLAVKVMKASPTVRGILSRFELEKERYIPAHSAIVAFVACAISNDMGWGSEATFQKLALAAFLHDAPIHDHALAAIHDQVELNGRLREFSEEEVRVYKNHPALAAEIVRGFSGAPADVDAILLQHHETADGRGFPRALSAAQVSPLAAVFVIAHEIVASSLRGSRDLAVIVEGLREKYSAGNFKKIFKAIKIAPAKSA